MSGDAMIVARYKNHKSAYHKRIAQELTDSYVLGTLGFAAGYTSYSPMPNDLAALVEKKREYILMLRALKQLQKLLSEIRNSNVTTN